MATETASANSRGVITYPDGDVQRTYAFIAAEHLYTNYWDGVQWQWADQGAPSYGLLPPNYYEAPSVITYREAGTQRIYAFLRDARSSLSVHYWDGAAWHWADQGKPAGVANIFSPSVITYRQGATQRIYAFTRSDNGHLYVNFWDGAQWRWADQGTPSNTTVAGSPSAITYLAEDGRQRIYVFVFGSNGRLYVNYWDGAQWRWADQGTPTGSDLPALQPAVITYQEAGSQRIYVFVRDKTHLYVNYWDGAQWHWVDQGNPPVSAMYGGSLCALAYHDGQHQRMYIFALGADTAGLPEFPGVQSLAVHYWDGAAWHWADQGRVAPTGASGWTMAGCIAYPEGGVQRIYAFVQKPPSVGLRANVWDGTAWRWLDQRSYNQVVVAPRAFMPALRSLVAHKNRTGITTCMVSLEEVSQTYPGKDAAEQVKRCLADWYNRYHIRYAMLVGDSDVFPVRYTRWCAGDLPPHHTLFVPSDLYYAALFGDTNGTFSDWNANHDAYYGEAPWDNLDSAAPANPDRVFPVPQIAVGRVLASTVDEIERYANKVIHYEQTAQGAAWTRAALLIAGRAGNFQDQEDVATQYLHGYTVSKLYTTETQDGSTNYTRPPVPPLTSDAVIAALNQGEGIASYMGHGDVGGWSIPGGFDLSTVAQVLTNADRLPIVYAVSCNTGQFTALPPLTPYVDVAGKTHQGMQDEQNPEVFTDVPPQPACLQTYRGMESMAEEMTVMHDIGAAVYIGCTLTSQYFGEDIHRCFFEALDVGYPTIGEVWVHALHTYYERHPPYGPNVLRGDIVGDGMGYFLEPWRYGIFGDPSLRIGGIR